MIQWYPLAAYPDYTAELGESPDGTAGIDLLIGDASCVGRGVGSAAIRAYADTVVFAQPAVRRCIGAPDVRNGRSIRAFEKAGFRFVRDAVVTGEAAPEHVMVLDRDGPGGAAPTG
jgi:RimJ/RimL family protein N-acetyltransferase